MSTPTSSGATVTNLNVLDTITANDSGGVEIISLQDVANALFPTNSATPTAIVDSAFWQDHLQLTFQASPNVYFTIWGTTTDGFSIEQTDQYGNFLAGSSLIASSSTLANTAQSFMTWVASHSTLSTSSNLVTADIEGGAGKDVVQGITNNASITNIIQGGAGADVLTGGAGQDFFVYNSVSDSPAAGQLNSGGQLAQAWDQITNFSHAQGDKIDLSPIAKLAGVDFIWKGTAGPQVGQNPVWYRSDRNRGGFPYARNKHHGNA